MKLSGLYPWASFFEGELFRRSFVRLWDRALPFSETPALYRARKQAAVPTYDRLLTRAVLYHSCARGTVPFLRARYCTILAHAVLYHSCARGTVSFLRGLIYR